MPPRHGVGVQALPSIERDKLGIAGGREHLLVFGGPHANHDLRCARCGSLLFSVVHEGAYVHVTPGTLMDSPSIRPTAHIFVGSKAPRFAITDTLPQHHEFP